MKILFTRNEYPGKGFALRMADQFIGQRFQIIDIEPNFRNGGMPGVYQIIDYNQFMALAGRDLLPARNLVSQPVTHQPEPDDSKYNKN